MSDTIGAFLGVTLVAVIFFILVGMLVCAAVDGVQHGLAHWRGECSCDGGEHG